MVTYVAYVIGFSVLETHFMLFICVACKSSCKKVMVLQLCICHPFTKTDSGLRPHVVFGYAYVSLYGHHLSLVLSVSVDSSL